MLSQLLFFFASSGSFLRSSLKSARLLLSFEITFALGGGAFWHGKAGICRFLRHKQ